MEQPGPKRAREKSVTVQRENERSFQEAGGPSRRRKQDELGAELGEEDFSEDKPNVEANEENDEDNKDGPSWTLCIFVGQEPNEFPGGPKTGLLSPYTEAIFPDISMLTIHERKFRQFNLELPYEEEWFMSKMVWSRLADVAKTGYTFLDSFLAMTKDEGALLMVELLGAEPADADKEHIADYTEERNQVEVERHQDYAIIFIVYLFMVVSWTIFADTSKNSVHLTYLRYFEELELVLDYVWGPVALTHLYKDLSTSATAGLKVVTGYMTLLQYENRKYNQAQLVGCQQISSKRLTSVKTYQSALNCTLAINITWAPYGEHKVTWPIQEICYYSNWLESGHMAIADFIALCRVLEPGVD
ncbi:hypothetical protein TSUD_348510 [Trifolium subterraneum]|uniref:Aminotransferase-like plant mobile domain-containing protein n=1 Tax=Trifolium subterraneum TaxID=3900 RepID=A0A2Z6NH70_TRISU|nr:hypothetical protein TSUD_348510 [Trifolium subterraneum]